MLVYDDFESKAVWRSTDGVIMRFKTNTFYLGKLGGTKQPLRLWNMLLFMPDNALSDASRYIKQMVKSGIKNDKLMALPSWSRDLNSIVKLLLIVWLEVYKLLGDITAPNCSKDKPWNAPSTCCKWYQRSYHKKFTSSADIRLLFVAQNKGRYTKHLSQSKR